MRHFHLTRNSSFCPTVNIDKLWSMVPADEKKDFPKQTGELVPVVDTLALGYGKVLGKGRLPDLPLIVKARFVSEVRSSWPLPLTPPFQPLTPTFIPSSHSTSLPRGRSRPLVELLSLSHKTGIDARIGL